MINKIKRKILLITDHFVPEIGSAASLFYELGTGLSKRDYNITVLTTYPRIYNLANPADIIYNNGFIKKENVDNIIIQRIKGFYVPKDSLYLRSLEQLFLPLILFIRGLFLERYDVIIVYSPPIPLVLFSILLARIKGCKIIANIHDLYPQSVIDIGLLKSKIIIIFLRWMERYVYMNSDYLTVHSQGNMEYLLSHNAKADKVKVIYNWMEEGNYEVNKSADFEGINIKDKFIISYAGILSIGQGLDIILESAKLVEDNSDLLFIIAGDGWEREKLLLRAKQLELSNVIFIPFQPKEKYLLLLASSDISLVCLRKELNTPVVPGKLMNIMASGKPVIACVPSNNDTAKIIKEANCGLVIEGQDSNALADAILELYGNPIMREIMGNSGSQYAKSNFTLNNALDEYEKIFQLLN